MKPQLPHESRNLIETAIRLYGSSLRSAAWSAGVSPRTVRRAIRADDVFAMRIRDARVYRVQVLRKTMKAIDWASTGVAASDLDPSTWDVEVEGATMTLQRVLDRYVRRKQKKASR